MFNLYRKSQTAQRIWIQNYPVQYDDLNAILLVVFFEYSMHQKRKEMREIENYIAQQKK